MAINISARPYKFFVNGKDYSDALIESTNWDTNGIDQTGLVKTTASFTLAQVRDLPGSLDDRLSSDWNIGQSVRILVSDSTGVLRPHPCGALRVLSSSWDYESRRLQVNAGCLISLLSFKAPTDPNKLDLEKAKLTDRTAIASELLRAAGIQVISGLNNLPYPLYYPFDISGSYLESLGKILYSSLHFGRIDSNEVFRVEPATLTQSVSMHWQIGNDGGDELYYRRLSSAEAPREIIEVRGNRQVGEIPKYPIISYSERYGDPKLIDPELIGGGITLFEQLSTEENYSFDTGKLEKTTQKYEPIGLIIPNTNTVFKTSLIESYYEVITYFYETNDEGKLIRTHAEIYRTLGEVLKEYYEYLASISDPNATNNAGLMVAETYTIDYLYDSKDRVSKIYTTRYKSKGELLSGLDTDWSFTGGITPVDLLIAESNVESWTRQSNNYWIHKVDNYKTAGVVNPAFFSAQEKPEGMSDETFEDNQRNQQLGLIIDNNASLFERSNSGQTVPPAAERSPQQVVPVSESVCGKAVFSLYGGNPYKEKERSYSVEYLGDRKRGINEDTGESIIEDEEPCDNAQAKAIAELEGALLAGRFKGQDIGVDIKDELFSWKPLQVLDCTEPDGTVRRYALDDSHWYLGQNRAIANFGAIWLGDDRNGNLVKPYTIAQIITGMVIIGGNVLALPYSLTNPLVTSNGGILIGGQIYSAAIASTIKGGIVLGGELVTNISTNIGIRGGIVLGGIIRSSTLITILGGVTIGGKITPISSIRGGIVAGGALLINKQSMMSGGVVVGGQLLSLMPPVGSEEDLLSALIFDDNFNNSTIDPLLLDLFN